MAMTERRDIREIAASAMGSRNLRADEHHHDVDVIAAVAWGSKRLGALLWRLKYAGDKSAHVERTVLWAIVDRVGPRARRRPGPDRIRVAAAVLKEWLNDRCKACHGRGFLGAEHGSIHEKRRRCRACNGHGEVGTGKSGLLGPLTKPCGACYGKGWVTDRELLTERERACPSCSGSRAITLTDSERAAMAGITTEEYQARWARRWESALDHLHDVDRSTGASVGRALRGMVLK
jgi:hypothetical protein